MIPQLINAILSRHHIILLGLRGQAKTRILRSLVGLLDDEIPMIAGCEINDDPYAPICRGCRERIAEMGDGTPIAWLPRDLRYVEKLATPDVTIADIIGDVDPIGAARGGLDLSNELTIHYGLLPRANRGIFAMNELLDLAGKIQVGLFNIMQEGDVQIKGYPVRLKLDVALVLEGIILVVALLALPAAAAGQMTTRLPAMMLLAIFFCAVSTTGGLFISYAPNLPAGATIVMLAGFLYLASIFAMKIRRRETP